MQMCPFCDRVYDESEDAYCPYCSGLFRRNKRGRRRRPFKKCPSCDGIMYWEGNCWGCTNCGEEIYSDEDDSDGTIEG